MFVILVYDASQRRDPKALRTCRKYLHWVQESVFEGELTEAQYRTLVAELKAVLKFDEDHVLVYLADHPSLVRRASFGVEKGHTDSII